ncbi:MAG: hypothetical protein GC160_16105 [Acidobacteria bacterium]|nr:hypothetical protein [Acidobacteriota bacterium]
MQRESLVRKLILTLCLAAWASAGAGRAYAQLDGRNAIGQVVQLPGQINELFVDESRGLLYAANFTGGRVEVVSMTTRTRLSSFQVSPIPAGASGMAVSADGRWMVVTNQPATVGVPQLSSVAIINLNDPSDRRLIPFDEEPVAVEFGLDNKALVVTTGGFHILNPIDGSSSKVFSLDGGSSNVVLPVVPPQFTREMVTVNMHASADRRWIFGVAEEFVFSYQIRQPVGYLTIRQRDSLVNDPIFNQVAASRTGDYFMVGQVLMRNDLRVIADSPEAPTSNTEFIGGTGIDSNIDTVYASFVEDLPADDTQQVPEHPEYAQLLIMDSDNLYVRQRLRLTERIVGRIVPAENGRSLYAVSDSGLMYVPLDRLADYPMLEIPLDQLRLSYTFDFCSREPITQQILLQNPTGGKSAKFSLSSPILETRPAVLIEPHQGETPAVVNLTVDPGAVGPTQGATDIIINIETDAINIPTAPVLLANIQDVDQRGNFMPVEGHLVSTLGDPRRDQFYVLDRQHFRVMAYDAQMRQIATFRTGNTPTWMALDRGGNFLVVANSQGENMTLIDLNQMKVSGLVFMPWEILFEGHYPHSLAATNRNIVIAGESSLGFYRLSFLTLPARAVATPDTLGVFTNQFSAGEIALAGHPDGDDVLIAASSGDTYLYETTSQRLIISRRDFATLDGAIGANTNYYVVDNHVLNRSLTPQGDFPDDSAAQESSGFAVLPDGTGVRSTRPGTGQVDTGSLQKLDPRDPTRRFNGVRSAQPPPRPAPDYSFMQTLTALRDGRLISTSSAGIVEFPVGYDTGIGNPRIDGITNGADFTTKTASGGLVSVFGNRLAASSVGAVDTPLPTQLGGTCVSANGAPLPLLFVSNDQINAQMPFGSVGPVSVQVHTRSGISDIFVKQVDPAAPAIFGVRGPDSNRYAAVFRENNTLSTLSNPLRENEIAVIYLTGLGGVTPIAVAGEPASTTILTRTQEMPTVEIGGVAGEVKFAGLTPGYIGLYQINVLLPSYVPKGLEVPLTVTMGANSATVNVRIVD